jgi:hypothetical protein
MGVNGSGLSNGSIVAFPYNRATEKRYLVLYVLWMRQAFFCIRLLAQ